MPLQATFANGLNLVGYQTSTLQLGSPLWLTFYWQPTQKIERDLEIFVQLLNRNHQTVIANVHTWPLRGAYRIPAWQPGQTMPLSLSLPIPANLDSGLYQLQVGLVDLIARNRVPLQTGNNAFLVHSFKIPLPPDHRVPENLTDINFADIIALNGYTLTTRSDRLTITLFWQALDAPQFDYTSFVHIVGADGKIVAQSDAQPRNGQYATSIWSPNEVIVDERTITAIPQGEYQVHVGWYKLLADGWERLPIVTDGMAHPDNRIVLDTFELP